MESMCSIYLLVDGSIFDGNSSSAFDNLWKRNIVEDGVCIFDIDTEIILRSWLVTSRTKSKLFWQNTETGSLLMASANLEILSWFYKAANVSMSSFTYDD